MPLAKWRELLLRSSSSASSLHDASSEGGLDGAVARSITRAAPSWLQACGRGSSLPRHDSSKSEVRKMLWPAFNGGYRSRRRGPTSQSRYVGPEGELPRYRRRHAFSLISLFSFHPCYHSLKTSSMASATLAKPTTSRRPGGQWQRRSQIRLALAGGGGWLGRGRRITASRKGCLVCRARGRATRRRSKGGSRHPATASITSNRFAFTLFDSLFSPDVSSRAAAPSSSLICPTQHHIVT